MKISLIPWEIIWFINLIVVVLWISAVNLRHPNRQKHHRRVLFLLPEKTIFYILFSMIFIVPLALNVLNIQFDVGAQNDAATTFDNPIEDLRPRRYDLPPREIYDAALKAVQSQKTYGQRWTITFADYLPEDRVGRIVAEVPVLGFVDEIAITIQPTGGQATDYRVDVYSASRVGEADFGENGRHIVQFFRALEKELANRK